MSKEKFIFEWNVGDEAECRSSGQVRVFSNEWFSNAKGNYKPHGETKKRYKAEKLAWQQSRMKKGDWVKLLEGYRGHSAGDKFQILEIDSDNDPWIEKNTCASRHRLKPCKPPKQKVSKVFFKTHTFNNLGVSADELRESVEQIRSLLNGPKTVLESENFKIEGGRLVYKVCGLNVDWGGVGAGISENHSFQPDYIEGYKNCGHMTSDTLREIANLLDRSTAKRR